MPVAASAVYFLNLRGDVLINRLYRDDVGGNMVDAFRMHIMQTKELGTCPVRQIGGCSFFYMRISNVYIVIVVSSNANVACAFKFVVEAVTLFKAYFGGAFDEDAIRNNFVLIYELLDEIMDFGYPQNLSPEILKLYITQEGVRSPFSSKPADKPVPNATLQVTGAVGWRREGLVYKKNEVFLDIVESVNLLMSSKGSVLRCDVTGKILMKCFLSGMPDLKLGLNDKIGLEKESQIKSRPTKSGKTIELDDVTFHQCVNLTRFNSEKTVSFVPPDGEFELMKYRITEGVNLPFRVLPTIKELGRTRMEVNVKVKSVFGAKTFALGVVVKIPVPKQTAKTSFQVTTGRAKYNAAIDCLVWKIRKFPGQTETTLSAEVELISTMTEKKSATRPPIQMEFQVLKDVSNPFLFLCLRHLDCVSVFSRYGRRVGTTQLSGSVTLPKPVPMRLGARNSRSYKISWWILWWRGGKHSRLCILVEGTIACMRLLWKRGLTAAPAKLQLRMDLVLVLFEGLFTSSDRFVSIGIALESKQ
ncbi:hypothetical protein RHGRI_020363 [Rhododendron griersonianum]|uniref:MHD domain-containing protein n=1 Tax=Rhododendron griersonianum TaxID=479676 RepID=A0AAV6JLC0_9ERIC|nr:hypothetical protein RHGRI_020363 [Rhododendron griersonianum]